ncbi:lysine permease [Didymosphaeria variabile]|uniref:Lysine permease n=1 Tax=Didymosphaeria variabile TaxID=1932322 RepID=A0A9W8XD15_9PLEO|nr:lysine permease [Didymosphaeria variabile]KAJ4346619.1 lysine permease [Didymosphaeria variabile]
MESITPKMDNRSEKSQTLSSSDPEKQGSPPEEAKLQRKLSSRHLQFVAIGGTVGTGIFIASGKSIATAGPAGALLAYVFIGTLVYAVMQALAEMSTYLPISGAFTQYAARFVDPSLGFSMGWIYWFSWSITYALELSAAGLIIQWWAPDLNIAIFISIFWVPITLVNFLPVDLFGEFEFWFASLKVMALVGFMIFSICINAGVGDQGYIGFKYWDQPGEHSHPVGAGESTNPRVTMPKAIRRTFWSIFLLFVFTIFFIGIVVPYDNESLLIGDTNASSSPLVIAAQLAGVSVLPHIINAVLLTAVLSAASSNVYSGSRILVGLSEQHCAPKFLQLTSKRGVPYVAVSVTAAVGALGYLNCSDSGTEAFNWLLNITSVAGLIAWCCIFICYLAFTKALRAQNIDRDNLPYRAWGGDWFAWYGLVFCVIITLTHKASLQFFIAYVSLILFAVMYIGHKIFTRSKFINAAEADIFSGKFHEELAETWEESSRSMWTKGFNAVFRK